MKRLFYVTIFSILFLSCSQEEETLTNLGNKEYSSIDVNINGELVAIDLYEYDGEFTFLENENFFRLQDVLASDNLVTYVDSNTEAPILFTNSLEYESFVTDEIRLAKRRDEIGLPNNMKTINARESGGTFTIAKSHRFQSGVTTISVDGIYSNRHVGFNTCITGGINYQDDISSISVDSGLRGKFYTHDDYDGRVLILDATNNPDAVAVANLAEIQRKTAVYLYDSDDFVKYLCGFICTSFNDRITSIVVTESGVSESGRTTSNVCGGTGGSGGSGGSDGPIKEEEHHK